jgi:signal transduction histidine kinase
LLFRGTNGDPDPSGDGSPALAWWSEADLQSTAEALAASVDGGLPGYLSTGVVVAGRPLAGTGSGEVLARRERDAVAVEVSLVDRAVMLASLRRRLALPAGAVAAALGVGLFGFLQSRRALRREFALHQAKSDFVSSVSHELRAPVASVRLLAERMAEGRVTDLERQHQYAGFIHRETRRLGALIENVLDVSRIEQGRKVYQFEESDVAALARDALDLMGPAANEKGVVLEAAVPAGETAAEIDPLALRQAVVNLLDNAIKHAPASSAVRVALSASGNEVALAVSDAGPGIQPAEQAKIFERFYRVGSEENREHPGAGIGLNLVRHTARAHGGDVSVTSTPGQGSTFTLTLPRRH